MSETAWDDALKACMGRRVHIRLDDGEGQRLISRGLLQRRTDETVEMLEERQWAQGPKGFVPVPERLTYWRICDIRSITLPAESPEEAAVVLGEKPDLESRITQAKGVVLQ